jgi:hypothetical protein
MMEGDVQRKGHQDINLEELYSQEELKALRIRIVRDVHREKVALHKDRVDARMAKLNNEARRARMEDDRRLIRVREEDWRRLYESTCQRMASSAFHIDLVQSDEERRQRLATKHRNTKREKQRNETINDVITSTKQLRCPKSPVMVKDERVNTAQIYTTMALNQKIVDDQLKATKQHRRKIASIIDKELEGARRMFPMLAIQSPERPERPMDGAYRSQLSSPTTGTPSLSRPTTAVATEQLPSLPSSPSPAPQPRSPLRVDTLLDPLDVDKNTGRLNTSHRSSGPFATSPKPGMPLRPSTGRSPSRRYPASPSQEYLEGVERLSTRFDSPSCQLPIARPDLPSTLSVSVLLPNYT